MEIKHKQGVIPVSWDRFFPEAMYVVLQVNLSSKSIS